MKIVSISETFGRKIEVEIGEELDKCDQFPIAVWVDGKERFRAFFTDKRVEEPEATGP